MPRVNLPPGCMGFKAADGTRYTAKAGTFVNVEDRHMGALRSQDYASAGLVTAEEKFFAVTKDDGRWCAACRRLWNRWNLTCSRCGTETVPEADMPRELPGGQYVP
jgi:hypothetical protein